jgi:hypothetical protein
MAKEIMPRPKKNETQKSKTSGTLTVISVDGPDEDSDTELNTTLAEISKLQVCDAKRVLPLKFLG